jgi:hypothetical protein
MTCAVISIDLSPTGGYLATGSGDWQARVCKSILGLHPFYFVLNFCTLPLFDSWLLNVIFGQGATAPRDHSTAVYRRTRCTIDDKFCTLYGLLLEHGSLIGGDGRPYFLCYSTISTMRLPVFHTNSYTTHAKIDSLVDPDASCGEITSIGERKLVSL